MCIHIYIYIYIYIYIHTYTYIYIYIFIYDQRLEQLRRKRQAMRREAYTYMLFFFIDPEGLFPTGIPTVFAPELDR